MIGVLRSKQRFLHPALIALIEGGLGEPGVHRADHGEHQEDRGLPQQLRHELPLPPQRPQREAHVSR